MHAHAQSVIGLGRLLGYSRIYAIDLCVCDITAFQVSAEIITSLRRVQAARLMVLRRLQEAVPAIVSTLKSLGKLSSMVYCPCGNCLLWCIVSRGKLSAV